MIPKMNYALCIDLEFWWCNEFLEDYLPVNKPDQILESTLPLLELLDKYNTKATFFVLGTVAEKYPELVATIHKKGMEIASHGYSHKMLDRLSPNEFEQEIERSVELLEAITGEKPIGFRAPSFSINRNTIWAFKVLEKHGFKYDASVFPIKTNLYGVPNAPLSPYKPSFDNLTEVDQNGTIIEFPMTVIKLGVNIPIAGGFYFRVLPFWFIKGAIKRVSTTRPVIMYIHPWETHANTPRLDVPLFSRFVTYYGVNSNLRKFERLIKEFQFAPVREVLSKNI
jgi:peptidoglycan-N-acetylglucosamine deacetylase